MPMEWPNWWTWEIELTAHVVRRMGPRLFCEADLRAMMEDARGITPAPDPDRWIVRTKWNGEPWIVIVEPDSERNRLVVITAYVVQ